MISPLVCISKRVSASKNLKWESNLIVRSRTVILICHFYSPLFANKANNVADCADGKTNVESYGCTWAWDDDAEDGADKNHQGGTPHVREGRRRINRPMVQSSAHNISSLWSSLLFSPRNCCGGGSSDGILCTDPNDEAYDENFMEEW